MRLKNLKIITLTMLLAFCAKSFAQERIITGKITTEDGPLIGASVIEKGTNNGTMTDFDGIFELHLLETKNPVLRITFVGFIPKQINLENDQYDINIQLEPDLNKLEDVVVIGYGQKKKVNLTGSVSLINTEAIEGKPVTNAYEALQGEAAGLIIQQGSSQPGAVPQINIRGISTISGNSPLIVVDGVIGSMNNINPNDIKSISVLKDAASASIYGSRAANGVILITTKIGVEGKPKFSYNGMSGIQEPTNFPKFADSWEYATLRNEALVNSGMAPQFTPEEILNFRDNGPNSRQYEALFRDYALQSSHNLMMSGSDNGMSYLLSLGYMDQESLFKGPSYGHQRYNARMNLEKKINEKITVGGRISFARNDIKDHAWWTEWIIEPTVRTPPIYPIKDANGNYTLSSGSNSNPLAQLEKGGSRKAQNDELQGNFSIEYEPIHNLIFRGVLGGNITSNKTHEFRKAIEYVYPGGGNNQNSVADNYSRSLYLNPFLTASYKKTFAEKHNFDILVGTSSENYKNEFFGVTGLDVPGNDYGVIRNVSEILQSGTDGSGSEWSLQSFFGRVGYNFEEKYLLEGNIRYDASSRFAKENRWGVFPSISGGWILSKEKFFEPILKYVPFVKIRASWGKLGNQDINDLYGYQSLVALAGNAYAFNNVGVTGAYYSVSNQRRVWEVSTMKNLGVDVAFFKSKLNVSFDVFHNLTEDILLQLPVPATYGLGRPIQNAGVVKNQGWEVNIDYKLVSGDFNHSFSFNLSDSRNEVVDIRGREFISGFDVQTILREGYPINSYYALKSDGFYNSEEEIANSATPIFAPQPKPGDIKYVDRNNDGQIDYENDRFVLGNSFPRYTFGATYATKWKGFDFSIFFQGVGKRKQWLRGELVEAFHNNNEGPVFERHLDRWTPQNMNSSYPRLTVGSESVNNAARSDFYIFDAKYLRIKNIQIGYNLPESLMTTLNFSSVRFYLSGLNVLTFSPLLDKGVDPENLDANGRVYPVSRVFSAGLNINF
jgi:TonB-linked SusC/RagA family outer membrane protein